MGKEVSKDGETREGIAAGSSGELKIKLKSTAISLFVLVGLSGFFPGENQRVNAQSEIKSVENNTCLSFIQPFNLYFHYYDLHVMLYFVGHPEYEAVEAMINLQNSEKPLVRVIITRHDQTQIDYVNDQKIMEEMKKVDPYKELRKIQNKWIKDNDYSLISRHVYGVDKFIFWLEENHYRITEDVKVYEDYLGIKLG